MSCTSVPPYATFSTCTPRQIARIGQPRRPRQRRRAPARSRRGPARPPRLSDAASRRTSTGATSPPPVSIRPSRPSSAAGNVGRRVEHAHLAAHVQYRLPVVLELAAIRDTDERHSVRARYIRAGTSIPIRASARVELVPDVRHGGGAPAFQLRALLAENRVAVVEGVEHLGEAERVLRQAGELERPHHLIDHVVQPRRPRAPSPSNRAIRARRPASRSRSETMSATVCPSRSCSLLKMLFARTTAYCRYGPVSPSKLSASSMSKTISLPRENFSMK